MTYNFKNLVFEGGGVKGIAYAGALEELNKRNYLKNVERVAGTSAGAITATLLALDFNVRDIGEIVGATNFKKFEDASVFFPSNLTRFFKRYGWFKGDKFLVWISEHIKQKTGNANITFRELKEHKDGNKFKDLYVVSTNLTNQTSDILSHETTPDMPVCVAVRMSMSIPLFFQSVEWADDITVDGGVAWNYPVNIFDNVKYVSNAKNSVAVEYNTDPGYVFNYETIGFRLDSRKEIQLNGMGWKSERSEVKNVKDYLVSLFSFMTEIANKRHLHQNDWNRTIFVDTLGVKAIEFNLSREKMNELIESGRNGVESYFNWRDKDVEWNKLPIFLP